MQLWQFSTSRLAGRERCPGLMNVALPNGTLLGPEGAGFSGRHWVFKDAFAGKRTLLTHAGIANRERPSLENCTVDASIF